MVPDDLKDAATLTALNAMMEKGYMSICTIDSVAKILGRDPRGDAYDVLRALHCIHFHTMAPTLRDRIPELILECLGTAPTFRFGSLAASAPVQEPRPRLGFLQRIVR